MEEKETKSKSPRKLLIIVAVLTVLIIGIASVGKALYGKMADGLYSSFASKLLGGKVTIDKEGEKLTLKDGDNKVTIESGGKVPDGFPADFPLYPGAKVTGSWSTTGEKGVGISVVLETSEELGKVNDYYKAELPKAGWTITANFTAPESGTFSFAKGDKQGFMGVTQSSGKSTISVTIGPK